MSRLIRHEFDFDWAREELSQFSELLKSPDAELEEAADILPRFRKWPNLCCLMGAFDAQIGIGNQYKTNYVIGARFECDLLASRESGTRYVFVEFEDAKKDSIFKRKSGRDTSYWSLRFNNGYNQIVDWFWLNDSRSVTPEFRAEFGTSYVVSVGILVVGRDHFLDALDNDRWEWRKRFGSTGQNPVIYIETYDSLYKRLKESFDSNLAVARQLSVGASRHG
ncbi:MAG: DUF4263 domain-containing protein [Alphaproteobacteria bacterium]|nr:DUF4263 domain-containing protein [Alphaproteobacteria bacterium]